MKESAIKNFAGLKILFVPILLMTFGQISSKYGMNLRGSEIVLFDIPYYLFFLALGYIFLMLRGIVWIYVLKKVPLSIAYPVLSISIIVVMIASYKLFNESITIPKIIGSIFIIMGSFFIASDKSATH